MRLSPLTVRRKTLPLDPSSWGVRTSPLPIRVPPCPVSVAPPNAASAPSWHTCPGQAGGANVQPALSRSRHIPAMFCRSAARVTARAVCSRRRAGSRQGRRRRAQGDHSGGAGGRRASPRLGACPPPAAAMHGGLCLARARLPGSAECGARPPHGPAACRPERPAADAERGDASVVAHRAAAGAVRRHAGSRAFSPPARPMPPPLPPLRTMNAGPPSRASRRAGARAAGRERRRARNRRAARARRKRRGRRRARHAHRAVRALPDGATRRRRARRLGSPRVPPPRAGPSLPRDCPGQRARRGDARSLLSLPSGPGSRPSLQPPPPPGRRRASMPPASAAARCALSGRAAQRRSARSGSRSTATLRRRAQSPWDPSHTGPGAVPPAPPVPPHRLAARRQDCRRPRYA